MAHIIKFEKYEMKSQGVNKIEIFMQNFLNSFLKMTFPSKTLINMCKKVEYLRSKLPARARKSSKVMNFQFSLEKNYQFCGFFMLSNHFENIMNFFGK